MTGDPIVRLAHVSCRANGQSLLNDIDLSIGRGECVLLCGPSGSGKTTLTKCINGLIPTFELGIERTGMVSVCGLAPETCEMYELAHQVGSVFQNPKSQFYYLTSDDELAFGLENIGANLDYIESRVAEVVMSMGIGHLRGRDVSRMSGGEKQSLVFASVAVADPELYVLDEPTANLDADSICKLHDQMAQIRSQGKTVVIAEHRLAFLADLIDRAILLQNGRIVREMTSKELTSLSDEERAVLGLRATNPCAAASFSAHVPARYAKEPVDRGLSLRGFTVRRKKRSVFDPISFDLAHGTVIGIVGANGSGKSTLLRGLAGLERETAGALFLDGRLLRSRRERGASCALVMQDVNHQLFSDSVRGECELCCAPEDPRIDEVLEQLDLQHLVDRHPLSLSGGQKQRLAVATALLLQRPLVLLDEPTSGLDFRHMSEIGALIRSISNTGSIVIVVTHDYELIGRCCDCVYDMAKGERGRRHHGSQ